VPDESETSTPDIRVLVSAGALLLGLLHVGWPTIFDNTALLLFFLAMVPWIIPWIVPFLSRYFASIEALGAKLVFIDQELQRQSSRLDELYALSMGEKVFNHLEKLNGPEGYGKFYVGSALPRELGYLENLGYLRFKQGLEGLDDFLSRFDGKELDNLSDWVELRDPGKSFLELRSNAQKRKNARQHAPS
jgi:hypothetical protein